MNRNFEKKFFKKSMIKMNSKTIRELRSIVKDKGFRVYYNLKRADLVALLLEQSTEEMPTSSLKGRGKIIPRN